MNTQTKRIISTNRRAQHLYHVEETYEAGIVLQGTEVKSLRKGSLTLTEAYAEFHGSNLVLVHAHIPPYSHGTYANHDPERHRRLLLSRKQLDKLQGLVKQVGVTLIPLSVYFSGSYVKVELGVCRGKKQYDKRAALKEQQAKRETDRMIAEHQRKR